MPTLPERDHVGSPDHPAGSQQPGSVGRKELVAGQDVPDQTSGGEQVRQREERDHAAGDNPQPGSLAVNAARIPDDQGRQQREQYGRRHPWRVYPVFRGQRDVQNHGGHDRQRHRPPVLAPCGGPGGFHQGQGGGLPIPHHI
jgi:hypothetical protein